MKVTVPAKTFHISQCWNECPFFSTEGMERMMVCNHPVMLKKCDDEDDPYANAIISHPDCDDGFPKQCPLVQGEQK
jgi:hypothetical protein